MNDREMKKSDPGRTLLKEILTGTAASGFIYTASILLPVLGFFISLLIPLPTLLYRLKLGRKYGSIVPIVVMILFTFSLGGITLDSVFLGELLLLGFVTGEFIEAGFSIEKTVLLSAMMALVSTIAGVLIYCGISNTGPILLISEYVAKNLALTMVLYEKMGMPEENILMLSNSLDMIEYILIRILPALVAASTLFVIWINILATRGFLAKKGIFLKGYESLKSWKAPDFLVWPVIGSTAMLFLPVPALKMIGINGLIILMSVYFFQGIAIVSYFFEKKNFPVLLKVTLYSIIIIQQIILLLVIGLGFFDIWLNFRKLNKKS